MTHELPLCKAINLTDRIVHRTNFLCHSHTPFNHTMTLTTREKGKEEPNPADRILCGTSPTQLADKYLTPRQFFSKAQSECIDKHRRFNGQDWQPKLATNAGIGHNGHFKNRQHIKKTHLPQSIFSTTFWRSRGETRSDSRTRSSKLQLDSRARSSKLQLKDWTTRGIAPFRRFTRTFTGPNKH